ncbi:hypothetical protein L1049_004887 [Liquidambar formosana]|uniref:GTD-binding domain-containing protein n=1 Tax=Liquidambar formosana TaxID=63359 RepID=A0AAP0WWZ6_LIQFO
MASHTVHSWTLVGLIGAFINLALAYCLLCGSALAFFASKFFGFFGLSLPCSCNGLCGFLSSNVCLHRLLVDYPKQKISSVQLLAKSSLPFNFNSTWLRDQVWHLNVELLRGRRSTDGVLELEGEASFSSCSCPRSHNLFVGDAVPRSEMLRIQESGSGVKGKGVLNQRRRSGVWRRRRAGLEYVGDVSRSHYNGGEFAKQMNGGLGSVDAGEDGLYDDGDAPTSIDLGELSGSIDGKEGVGEDLPSIEEIVNKPWDELVFAGNESNAIRILKQQLEEGQATRDTLYLELEKERAAAATAADEAMTMIVRLQKDKASIEMEAWQYQRMIEEKSAYDDEEMNILKEIIVRREREKHFLEKELEVYRQMTSVGYKQTEGDLQDKMDKWGQKPANSLDLNEDLVLLPQHINFSECIGRKEMGEMLTSL